MAATHPDTTSHTRRGEIGWVNVVAGVLLFIAPWVLGYSGETAAFANHLILGAGTAVVGLLAATLHHNWAWVNVAGAAYTLIAIPAYGYDSGAAIGTSIVLGLIIGLVALANGWRRTGS